MTKNSNVQLNLDLPLTKYKQLKTLAELKELSVSDLFLELVDDTLEEHHACLSSSHIPHLETMEPMHSNRDTINLEEIDNLEEYFFKTLGIDIKE